MHTMLLEIPTHFETERLIVRSYEPGDGAWYYAVGQKNHKHLERYESGNVIFDLKSDVVYGLLRKEAWNQVKPG